MRQPWILMYHAVLPYEEDPHLICVSPERFRSQMEWIARRGLRAVSIRELHSHAAVGAARRLVGLTFDDAYGGFREYVSPVLDELGFSATVFAVAGRLGGVNDWDDGPKRPLMDQPELRSLAAEGIEIGSHGLTHARLTTVGPDELVAETERSRALLREAIIRQVDGFCYPYGAYDAAAVAAVRTAGYDYACAYLTRARGERFLLPRDFVGERDGALRLAAKLAVHRLGWVRGPGSR